MIDMSYKHSAGGKWWACDSTDEHCSQHVYAKAAGDPETKLSLLKNAELLSLYIVNSLKLVNVRYF